MVLVLKENRIKLDIKCFTIRVVMHQNTLSREPVDVPSLKLFKAMFKVWVAWSSEKRLCPWRRGWKWMVFKGSFQIKPLGWKEPAEWQRGAPPVLVLTEAIFFTVAGTML